MPTANLGPAERAALVRTALSQLTQKKLTPQERAAFAKEMASTLAPEYRSLIDKLEPEPRKGLKNAKIEHRKFLFDPDMPIEVLPAAMIHLVDHGREHHLQRREDRDPATWQKVACAESIERWDEIITAAGLRWPEGLDERHQLPDFHRDEAERLYEEAQEQQPSGGEGQGQPDEGDLSEGDGDSKPEPGEGHPGQGKPTQGQPGQGTPGETADGVCKLEDNSFDDDMFDDVGGDGDGDGDGDDDGDGQPGQSKPGQGQPGQGTQAGSGSNQQAFEVGRDRAASSIANKLLRVLMRGPNPIEYTTRRPSKRSRDGMIISTQRELPHDVVWVFDTSSSVKLEMINRYVALARKLQRLMPRSRMMAVAADDDIREHGRLEFVLHRMKGRGGTRMDVAIPRAHELFPRCKRMVIVTDGMTAWPPAFKVPTVVLIVNSNPTIGLPDHGYFRMPEHVLKRVVRVTEQELLTGIRPRGLGGRVVA